MNFKQYVDGLNRKLEKHPESAEYQVVTSIDDDGNGFNVVNYAPSFGNYDKDNKEFDGGGDINAVCVN